MTSKTPLPIHCVAYSTCPAPSYCCALLLPLCRIDQAPSGAVFYGVYDLLKAQHLADAAAAAAAAAAAGDGEANSNGGSRNAALAAAGELPVVYTLLYGAIAGGASEAVLYPLEVIRRRMQLQSMAAGAAAFAAGGSGAPGAAGLLKAATGALAPHGAAHIPAWPPGTPPGALARVAAACTAIIRADGPRGFYSGLAPNMLQVLPSAALSYGTYEAVKRLLGAASL